MRRISLVAKRATPSTISPDGKVITGASVDVPFTASIQPADKKQLESYPFLRDYKQLYTLYSDTELLVSEAQVSECDTVSIYGREFDVLTCEAWQNRIRSHFKITVGK